MSIYPLSGPAARGEGASSHVDRRCAWIAGRATRAAIAMVAVLCAPVAIPASGQPPARPADASAPSVDELVERALARAPSIAARRARLAAAQAALPAADTLPDPALELEWRDGGFPRLTLGSDVMSMVGVAVRQPLALGGRRPARRAVAAAEVDQRHAEIDALACDLTAAVRVEYARLYAIDRERAVLRDADEMARLLVETASARYASGASDQATVLRAQLERTRLDQRVADLHADRAIAVATLNRLIDEPPDAPIGEVRTLPALPPLAASLAGLPEVAAQSAPEVAVRKAEVALAASRLDLVKRDLRPNLTVGGSFYWQGGWDRVASVTLGVEWPLRKAQRQMPMIAASEHELEAARLDARSAAADMRAEAARLVEESRRSDDQVLRYQTALLPQSSAALDAARSSYLGGRGDFASVVDEFRRWTEIRVELARREAAGFAARGQLDVLVRPIDHGDWRRPAGPPSDLPKEPRS